MISSRLGPALIAGVQRRKVRLADISGSLRPSTLRRGLSAEARRLAETSARLAPALRRTIARNTEQFGATSRRFRPAALQQERDRKVRELARLSQRMSDAGQRNIAAWRTRLEAAERLRLTLGYEATLDRGFAVVRSEGAVVTDSKTAKAAPTLEIQFADGRVTVGGKPAPRKTSAKPPEQGSLF